MRPLDGSPAPRPAAGLTVERLSLFTDAVFAIAMTLLVIDIAQPEGGSGSDYSPGDGVSKAEAASHLLDFLRRQGGSFFSYVLAFFLLWLIWRSHHKLLDQIDRLSPKLVGLHFPTLILIGFVPYTTALVGRHLSNPTAAIFYTVTFGGLLLCRAALLDRALRDGLLREDVDFRRYHLDMRVDWIVAGYWFATLLLCWWAPWCAIAWVLTAPLATLVTKLLERGYGRRIVDSA